MTEQVICEVQAFAIELERLLPSAYVKDMERNCS